VRSRPAGPPRFEGRVDEDACYAFARATNDRNERYDRHEAVPPLFTATLAMEAQWTSGREGAVYGTVTGARGGAHGEHDVYYWGQVRPGMELRWDAATHSAHQTKGGVLVTQRVLFSDGEGTPLVEHLWSNFLIGGTIEQEMGPPLAGHTFPEDARSRLVASRSLAVDRDQAFRYAGVSGDHAGHALTDDIARREGHPGKILQGMCTFGLISGPIVDVTAGGDPDRLRRLAVRFAAPAFPGREIVVNLYEAGGTAEGGRAYAFEGIQDGVAVIKHGRVELVP
jgi:acyl dehydratase